MGEPIVTAQRRIRAVSTSDGHLLLIKTGPSSGHEDAPTTSPWLPDLGRLSTVTRVGGVLLTPQRRVQWHSEPWRGEGVRKV